MNAPGSMESNSPFTAAVPEKQRAYRRIAVEESFILPEIEAESARSNPTTGGTALPNNAGVREIFRSRMRDLGEGRIAAMDAAGIDVQLLSLGVPGVQNFAADVAGELARLANDRVSEAVGKYPARLAALATIAPQDPESAARELERAVGKLNLKGVLINSHTGGAYLDEPRFAPILEVAEALGSAIYIHPRDPSPAMAAPLDIRGFNVGWSYAVETGTHIIRLIAAGIFDRFPNLQVVIGHMGEMIPFYLDRLDNRYRWEWNFRGAPAPLKLLPSEYFRRNIMLTTSGVNYSAPLLYAIDALGIDRVMFAADYPWEDIGEAVSVVEQTPLSPGDRRKLFELNARGVFGIA